ncbi:MAG: hypothetical protein AB8B61_01345 [Cyclobacteriaceae bacterium]
MTNSIEIKKQKNSANKLSSTAQKMAATLIVSGIFLMLHSCTSSQPASMAEAQKVYLKNKKPQQWASLKKQKKVQDQKRKQFDWALD